MKRSAHSKAVIDDSWITVGTTSLHQHYYIIAIALICHIVKVNSTSCMIHLDDWSTGLATDKTTCKKSTAHFQNVNLPVEL